MKNSDHDYMSYSPMEIVVVPPTSMEVSSDCKEPDTDTEVLDYMNRGYSAAPLLLSRRTPNMSVVRAQKQYYTDLLKAIDSEFSELGVKERVATWVKSSILNRIDQRVGLNVAQFDQRLYDAPAFDYISNYSSDEILSACDATLYGTATVAQARLAQLAYGVPSGEYGNVTIIGNTRKDAEAEMWNDLQQLIGYDYDVSCLSEGVSQEKIVGYDRQISDAQNNIGAVRIMAKRAIGIRGDLNTEIKVRETVILDTSPSSGFDQSIVQQVIAEANAGMDPMQTTAFEPVMQALWKHGMDSHIVLARNETVYGVSHEIAEMLAERRDRNLGARAIY